tara:strand:+ start:1838 stop:2032 length:195 start_codon:yes stop_codon:yes gene_type:complete
MKKFKVIALSCNGKCKMFKSGDTVSEIDFEKGVAIDLADSKKSGGAFLKEIVSEVKTKKPAAKK